MDNIKERLSQFEHDDIDQEIETLKQMNREKVVLGLMTNIQDERISDLELNIKHYESKISSSNLNQGNILKHKDESIKELKQQIKALSKS